MAASPAILMVGGQMKRKINPILFVPGALLWAAIGYGAVTGDSTMITIAVIGVALTMVVLVAFKWKASDEKNAELKRIWQDGQEARARIISIGTGMGGMNGHPMIDFQLEVTVEGQEPYRAGLAAMISTLAIPRVQPECVIAVKVDSADPHNLVVDEALTPYGYK